MNQGHGNTKNIHVLFLFKDKLRKFQINQLYNSEKWDNNDNLKYWNDYGGFKDILRRFN